MSIGLTTALLNFETLKEIGQDGKNSNVYIAHDKQLDAEIVIKKIAKANFQDIIDYYTEAKQLYDSDHPNVVKIKYACEDDDFIYLAMPYYSNGSIKRLIESTYLTVRQIVRYGIQFLSGVNNIHVKGLIHFDIKPDNILISDYDEALVSDFGLTKNMDVNGLAKMGRVYISHVPPEAFKNDQQSMLYDIYSCGVTLYRMCNGNGSYYAQMGGYVNDDAFYKAIQNGKFPDRNNYLPHIPKSLRRIINKMMHVDSGKRYQTLLHVMNDLGAVNENLDWEFDYKEDGGLTYQMQGNGKIYTVKANQIDESSNFAIETVKIMDETGNTTRVSLGCVKEVSIDDIGDKIAEILHNLNPM